MNEYKNDKSKKDKNNESKIDTFTFSFIWFFSCNKRFNLTNKILKISLSQ